MTTTCPNCGCTSFDSAGDCVQCFEPGVIKASTIDTETPDVVSCVTLPTAQQIVETKPENIKCCDVGSRSHDTTIYDCWVDHRPCEVVALFSEQFDGDLVVAMERGWDWLPCQRCRAKKANAEKLLHLRLGRRERHVLLNAPKWDGSGEVVKAPEPGRAADEANRRAIRKLYAAGLVWIGRKRVEVKTVPENCYGRTVDRDYLKRCVWLTPLGEIVVNAMHNALAAGLPIRWAQSMPEILAVAEQRDAHKMLGEFRDNLAADRTRLQELARYYGTGAALGGDVGYCSKGIRECMAIAETYGKILKAIIHRALGQAALYQFTADQHEITLRGQTFTGPTLEEAIDAARCRRTGER